MQICYVSVTVNRVNPVTFVFFVVEEAEFDTTSFRCFPEREPFESFESCQVHLLTWLHKLTYWRSLTALCAFKTLQNYMLPLTNQICHHVKWIVCHWVLTFFCSLISHLTAAQVSPYYRFLQDKYVDLSPLGSKHFQFRCYCLVHCFILNHTVPAVSSLCCPLWWTDSFTLFFNSCKCIANTININGCEYLPNLSLNPTCSKCCRSTTEPI